MREAIGGTWIMQLVIVFMLLFVAFLALSLNYSKAFQMKNDILTMIEKNEGMTENTVKLINNYLKANGYSATGKCKMQEVGFGRGVKDLSSTTVDRMWMEETDNAGVSKADYYYCFNRVETGEKTNQSDNRSHYEVQLFFYFNLPVIGNIFKFTINGTTNEINIPADKYGSL